jgi:hypothetical protein
MTYRRALNPSMLTINELGLLVDLSPSTIRKRRIGDPKHPLFGKAAFKTGTGSNSPLRWWRRDVEAYFASMGRMVDWSVIDGPSAETARIAPPRSPDPVVALMTMAADLAEGIAGVLLDVAAKARAGEYGRS